ncbi:uncharacterized protein K460DRAFT_350625 [Cucurbitaria berberidis CBS 394.84]|uniref:Uncharacterized protein n=1 Tax=Cucurbitaria berberidis CBS 394.84 TaxID=1168544 RepID=A0A9P4GT50_9PLEO|nr:uncharacterized protein K460DRAFT_350625 [Cucurbitaria berberidis CBS 394.84]KAF1850586.1 hypothetical protein K460DRAFT_350625 [Cucurbitaria berberidis CBS 394.84]
MPVSSVAALTEGEVEPYPSPASTSQLSIEAEEEPCLETNDIASPKTSVEAENTTRTGKARIKKTLYVLNRSSQLSKLTLTRTFLPISTTLRHSNPAYFKELPDHFYRVTFEKTATPSRYEINDLHISEHPKLKDGYAFQALAEFFCEKDLTRTRIKRHHKQSKKKDPSSYVSVTNSLGEAAGRCRWHYYTSKRRGRRIIVVEISTAGLVPAELEMTEQIEDGSTVTLNIPIWVRDVCRPVDGSPITTEEFKSSGADLYLSVLEQRDGGFHLGVTAADGQWHEFMAGGFIEEKYVTRVLPYDGMKVHRAEGDMEVRSLLDMNYVFDWEAQRWRYDPLSTKRKRSVDDEEKDDYASSNTSSDGKSTRKRCCPSCGYTAPDQEFENRVMEMTVDVDLA